MKAPHLILLVAPLLAGPAFGDPGLAGNVPIVVAQASNPELVASSSVNGRTIKVFSVGNGSPSVNVEQINDTATLKFGAHTIVVAPDGRVSVDGKETSYGTFKELDVTIRDGNTIEVKVAN